MATELIPTDPESLGRALHALEGVDELREKLAGHDAWLVGGAVRDLLLGGSQADLDVVVEGDAAQIASALGSMPRSHERFGTASVDAGGFHVDVAAARRETYEHPGALPTVERATLGEDLARRDFTVNAMALPLEGEAALIDPHGGRADLEAGLLRVIHDRSFLDDPTRALRAARYAARLGLSVEPETLDLLKRSDLDSVAVERVYAELQRIVAEETAPAALGLLAEWGLAGVDAGAPQRLQATRELLDDPDWAEVADLQQVSLGAAIPVPSAQEAVRSLTAERPTRPSEGVALIGVTLPHALVAARIAGAEWLDDWAREWRKVSLDIDGNDLVAAGVMPGPPVGAGLRAALDAKLDGEISSRKEELQVALAAAAAT